VSCTDIIPPKRVSHKVIEPNPCVNGLGVVVVSIDWGGNWGHDIPDEQVGISGYEGYRGDLALMYFVSVDPATGRLVGLQMVPMQIRNLRLNRALAADVRWLEKPLNREGKRLGTWAARARDGTLTLNWE
jgi:poly-gamma-glutamate capsule biosynthesis protein CapA/YwtB (metallophosphatase superfamily)